MPDDEANIKEYSFTIQEVIDNPDFFFHGALIHYKFRCVLTDWERIFPDIKERMIRYPESFHMSDDIKWDEYEDEPNQTKNKSHSLSVGFNSGIQISHTAFLK